MGNVTYTNNEDSGGGESLDTRWREKITHCLQRNNVSLCYNKLIAAKLQSSNPTGSARCDDCSGNRTLSNSSEVMSAPTPPSTSLVSILTSLEDVLKSRLRQELNKLYSDIGFNETSGKFEFFQKNQTAASERKIKKDNLAQLLVTPGLIMAGIMPWVLPQIKTLVMIVGFMNQVAFSMSFFALLRRLIFEKNNEEHIFYVNQGYTNEKRDPHYGTGR